MGRGDKRTKRGKITLGSFGKSRPKAVKTNIPPKPAVKPAE
jgi:30S ribosomal protein S31